MAENLFPITTAQTVPDFFADPVYSQATYEKKKLMEADFASRLGRIGAAKGVSGPMVDDAVAMVKKQGAKTPSTNLFQGIGDVATEIGLGFTGLVGGVTRYIGNEVDSNMLRSAADNLGVATTRMRSDLSSGSKETDALLAERDAAQKKQYGKDIPLGTEVGNAFGTFAAKPIRSIANVLGTAVPGIATAVVTGGVGIPALAAMATTGALSTAGDAAGQADQSIIDMPIAELRKLASFQKYIAAGDTEAIARERVAQDASILAGRVGLAVGAITGPIAGKVGVDGIIARTALGKAGGSIVSNRLAAAGKAGASEFGEEFATAVAGNYGVQSVDPSQKLTEGAVGAGVSGALAGGVIGGVGGNKRASDTTETPVAPSAVAATETPVAPSATTTPSAVAATDAQLSLFPDDPSVPTTQETPANTIDPVKMATEAFTQAKASVNTEREIDVAATLALPDEALALTGLSPEGISQFREALQNLVAVEEQQTKQMTLDLVPPAAETTAPINSGATNGRKTNTPSSKRSPPPARRTNPSTVAPSPEPTGATSTIATEATDSTALATIAAATDPATGAITDIAAVNSAVAPLAEQAPVGATTTNKGKKGANSSRSNKVVATPSAVSIGTSPSPSGQADQASIPQQQVQPTPARTGTANGLLKQPSAKLNKQAAQAQRQAQAEDAWGEFAPEGAPAFNELSKTHQEMWEQRNTFNEEKLNQPNLKKEDQPNYAGDVADILRLHRNDSVASKAKSASIDNKIDDEISALPADQQDAVFKAAEIAQLDTDQYVRGVFDESLKTSKKNAISNAVNQAVGVTSNVLSSALKKLISALSAVALSVSLYFASPITDATAQQRAPAVVATFVANQKLTPDANVVAAWVQQAKDHSGRNYVIADKKAGVLYVMNSKGGVLATAPALYGMNKGDSLEVGRTPAGRFMLQNTELVNEGYGGDIQVFVRDGPSVMAIHRVWLGRPSESREARLASATPNDNRITAGCINAPAEFYNKHLRDLDQSRLYVIPETERVDTWVEKLRQENKSDPSPVPAQGALFAGLLALRRMRKLGLRTAVGTREGVPQNYNEVKEFLSTSESPQRPRLVRSTDSFVEQLVDSHTPFFRWLDRDINHPLWMALKLSKSRQTIIHDDIAKSIDLILSKTVKAAAKSVGVSTADMLKAGGYYAVLRYVNTGGNQEILTRKQDQLSYLRAEYLAAASFAQSTGTPEALVQRNKAGDAVRVQQEAITHFQQRVGINRQNVTDKKDEFLGGYTDKEAADLTIEAEKKWGAANLASVADAIVKLQNYWRQEGITKGVFFPDEVAKWTQNPNYVPTSGVPERDLSEGDTHGYGLFGKSEKDYAREGRETPSDDAYLAVVQQALSVGNRIAHAPFAAQLKEMADNKEMGLGYYGNQGDNSQLYTVKEHDAVNNVTRQRSINFPKEASLAYEAMRGANQEYSDNAVLKAVGMYTKAHGLMVTYLNPMFAPIASIKDLGERAHTLLVRPLTGSGLALNRVKFVADMTKYYPQGILAGWKFALGKPDTSPAGMALKELAMVGGLSLRGRSVARDHMSFARHANIQGLGLTEAAQWMRNYADAFEVLAPLAAYRAVMEQNPGKMSTAGFRVLSAMNFNDKGTKTSKISPLYMFFNPAMQGARATVKNLSTKQGVAFFVAKVTASYALYVLAQALSDDDEELGNSVANLPEYTVSRNVPLVFGDKVIKVPVPFGIDMIAWNTAVALHKLFTGAYDLSTAAGAIALAALDQTSPVLPATEASFHKNTMFWLSKTMAPHFTQIAVNLGASKNDFGGDLYTKYVNPNQPKSMQSKPSTNSGWDDLAQTVAKAGGPDWHPETFRETIKTVIVGPMFSLARAAIEHDDGTSNEMDANRATMDVLGLSRVVGTDRGRAARVYYARAEDTQELMKKATTQNGLPPQEKRGAPLVETTKWLAETQLSGSEQERVLLYLKTDKELKAVTGETPGEAEAAKDKISRAFISKYDALKKGQ